MLIRLSIRNFALVGSADLEFGPGCNVLTGETGAGKSMLVDALYFLLGDRMSADLLRAGEETARVEAFFQLTPGSPVLVRLEDWGLSAPGGELLVRREFVRSSGRTRSTVNGSMATAAMVAELGDLLVDIHGQHEHQAIFNVGRHRRLVDSYGRLDARLKSVAEACAGLSALLDERVRLGGDARDVERRLDLLRFQRNELEAAGIETLDEEGLKREYSRLKNGEKIANLLSRASGTLAGDGETGIADRIGHAVGFLTEASRLDPELESLASRSRDLQEQASRLSADLDRRLGGETFDEDRFREVSARMDLLHTLRKKYGQTIGEIRDYLSGIREELAALGDREERLKSLEAEIRQAVESYAEEARALTRARRESGERLAAEVQKVLKDLGLAGARLSVAVVPQEDPESPVVWEGAPRVLSPHGWDRVEFTFSANPGEPLRPLQKTASGGEASRVMLALKAVLSDSDDTPTLVFDEIDTGVGGRTAPAVGVLLSKLAAGKQILCISHLAPIASRGSTHLKVVKSVRGRRTEVGVVRLEGQARLEELAQMMSGEVSETSVKHARELMERVRDPKQGGG